VSFALAEKQADGGLAWACRLCDVAQMPQCSCTRTVAFYKSESI